MRPPGLLHPAGARILYGDFLSTLKSTAEASPLVFQEDQGAFTESLIDVFKSSDACFQAFLRAASSIPLTTFDEKNDLPPSSSPVLVPYSSPHQSFPTSSASSLSRKKVAPLRSTTPSSQAPPPDAVVVPEESSSSKREKNVVSNRARDAASRLLIVTDMTRPPLLQSPYSLSEDEFVKNGLGLLTIFNWSGLLNPSKIATKFSQVKLAQSFFNASQGDAYGRVLASSRASPEQMCAFFFDVMSATNVSALEDAAVGYLDYRVLEHVNEHHLISYQVRKVPLRGVSPRSFLTSVIWKRLDSKNYVLVATSIDFHPSLNKNHDPHNSVRSDIARVFKFTRRDDSQTDIDYAFHFNFKGNVPSVLMAKIAPQANLDTLTSAMSYFQHIRVDCDEHDGAMMGDMLMVCVKDAIHNSPWKLTSEFVAQAVDAFFDQNEASLAAEAKHGWFRSLIKSVVYSTPLAMIPQISESAAALSHPEATLIGRSLTICIVTNSDVKSAVDEFILAFAALQQFDRDVAWFRPMTESIAGQMLSDNAWGMKLRVILGALLSSADMASDVATARTYILQGKDASARALITIVAITLVVQLILVFIIWKRSRKGRKALPLSSLLKDVVIVLTCMKPAYDAYHVARPSDDNDMASANEKMFNAVSTKLIEMGFESIPGGVMQCYIFFDSTQEQRTPLSLLSIIFSSASAAFAATSLSYDLDISPHMRKLNSAFYGYVKNVGRGKLFAQMFLWNTCQVLNKILASALFLVIHPNWFLVYVSGDMGLFFFQKLVKRDFIVWVPSHGVLTIVFSVIHRSIIKVLVDYTGIVHLRHSKEMGGLMWTLNLGIVQISCWAATLLYLKAPRDSRDTADRIPPEQLYSAIGVISLVWLLSFSGFLMSIDRRYLHTFFSTETGKASATSHFLDNDSDELKAFIFRNNEWLWKEIRPQVKIWVKVNWVRWNEEKPKWFTQNFVDTIPDDLIPIEELARLRAGGKRRKSSIVQEMRRFSVGGGGEIGVSPTTAVA